MTTHVFIVDDNTFKYHLEYMFAGTGAKDYCIDFNNKQTTSYHHSAENLLVSMIADGWRIRKDDFILFYLERDNSNFKKRDGKIFGIFQAVNDGIFLDNNDAKQFLKKELKRSLTFRLRIKPYQVFKDGITEWEALDEINGMTSPAQMTWSLIYRKLRGKRGNTMVTIPEAEYLFSRIRQKNNNQKLLSDNFTFDGEYISKSSISKEYTGRKDDINILPRLIEKYKKKNSFEAHLQEYIVQNLMKGGNKSLNTALDSFNNIEWIGNEVYCGVGMQRIDIMLSKTIDATQRIIMPIELKSVFKQPETINLHQLARYVEWVKQYYIPNRRSDIQPVLICLKVGELPAIIKKEFAAFNNTSGVLPLKYIEYSIKENNLYFEVVEYDK